MKRLMYFSISILCLAIAGLIVNNLITPRADAQAGGQIVGYAYVQELLPYGAEHYVVTANGDVFGSKAEGAVRPTDCNGQGLLSGMLDYPATYIGNIWTGAPPVSTSPETWGKIKGQYDRDK